MTNGSPSHRLSTAVSVPCAACTRAWVHSAARICGAADAHAVACRSRAVLFKKKMIVSEKRALLPMILPAGQGPQQGSASSSGKASSQSWLLTSTRHVTLTDSPSQAPTKRLRFPCRVPRRPAGPSNGHVSALISLLPWEFSPRTRAAAGRAPRLRSPGPAMAESAISKLKLLLDLLQTIARTWRALVQLSQSWLRVVVEARRP